MIALWRRTAAGPRWLTAGGALLRPTLFLRLAGSSKTAHWRRAGQHPGSIQGRAKLLASASRLFAGAGQASNPLRAKRTPVPHPPRFRAWALLGRPR